MTSCFPYPWQESIWSLFGPRIKEGNLPHALLFAGQAGVGKNHMASLLANRLVCDKPSSGLPCGECKSCLLYAAGSHPDVAKVEPEEEGKLIKVDQIRELIEFANKTAQHSGYRVILISPAEQMNIAAANALLKSLEEPGGLTVFILVVHEPGRLLATTRSRCQLQFFPVPDKKSSLEWLATVIGDKENAALALGISSGSPLKAVSFVESEYFKDRTQIVDYWLGYKQGQGSLSNLIKSCSAIPEPELLDWLQSWLLDLLKLKKGLNNSIKNNDLYERFKEVVDLLSEPGICLLTEKTANAKKMLHSAANPNRQLLLEQLFIEWKRM